eukprot:scaffold10050_cov142-Amphora_coffeaeformis.AAC.3
MPLQKQGAEQRDERVEGVDCAATQRGWGTLTDAGFSAPLILKLAHKFRSCSYPFWASQKPGE